MPGGISFAEWQRNIQLWESAKHWCTDGEALRWAGRLSRGKKWMSFNLGADLQVPPWKMDSMLPRPFVICQCFSWTPLLFKLVGENCVCNQEFWVTPWKVEWQMIDCEKIITVQITKGQNNQRKICKWYNGQCPGGKMQTKKNRAS